ncbi:MAG: RNA polymerase sigma factor [Phycisphaerales bacterium JB059]
MTVTMDERTTERVASGGVSDEALASRARAGDRACFGMLVDRFEGRIYRLALSRLRDRHDAEEVTQEAFLRAWRSIKTYREGEPVAPWVLTIARREVINVVRRRQKAARDKDRERPESAPVNDRSEGESVWTLAREALSPEVYEALWLRYREDLDPGQIARVMGKTRVGVRVMLHRARKTLSEIISSRAGEARETGVGEVAYERA